MIVKQQNVSVVIVNHNAGSLLVESVRIALLQAVQVIVIDNASLDRSMSLIQSVFAGDPRLFTHQLNENIGFAAACNVGLGFAKHDYLLFLNPDSLLGENALKRMVEVLESESQAGMVGGLLTNLDGTEQGGGRRAVPTPWRSFVRAFGLAKLNRRWPRLFFDFHLHKQPLPDCPIEVEAISGALMLVRRSAMEEVGLWDDNYFLHCEDLDWCMRFRQHGWKILFVPDAHVIHYHGHSSKSKPIFVEWHKHRGMTYFYRKFFQHQYPGGMLLLVNTGVWIRFGMVAAFHSFKRIHERVRGRPYAPGNRDRRTPQERRRKYYDENKWLGYEKRQAQRDRRHSYNWLLDNASTEQQSAKAAVSGNSGHVVSESAGMLGASSFVGSRALPLLAKNGKHIAAFTRKPVSSGGLPSVSWRQLSERELENGEHEQIREWISLAPVWALPAYFKMFEAYGAKRVVALSSTSRYTKANSTNHAESELAAQIAASEELLRIWAEQHGVEWIIIRPTLIYGYGQDRNISVIANFVRKFKFVPLAGQARGLRQPVHVDDVAATCVAALAAKGIRNKAFNLSGGEILEYREMVARIFKSLNRKPRMIHIPLFFFKISFFFLKVMPKYRKWSSAMAERMNTDMVFDHKDVELELGILPRSFQLTSADVIQSNV